MDNMVRTVHRVLESDMLVNISMHKKVYNFVKYVTGKRVSTVNDYELSESDDWYGYQTVTVKGDNGYIRLALKPLFEVVE